MRTTRDNRDWIVESVSHTEVATQLRLIRNKALALDALYGASPEPYNRADPPAYNARPGVPSVEMISRWTADDPRTAAVDEKTIDWVNPYVDENGDTQPAVGGGIVAKITPPRFGHPLTAIEYHVRLNGVLQNGEYYIDGAIDKPSILPIYLPLIPMGEGNYDISARSCQRLWRIRLDNAARLHDCARHARPSEYAAADTFGCARHRKA